METTVENPLVPGLLEGAAYLCLAKAATTDVSLVVPGAERMIREKLHASRRRFEAAQAKLQKNADTHLLELGITSEDCRWAALFFKMAKNPADWKNRFEVARDLLAQEGK